MASEGKCPQCGAAAEAGARFCMACGASLAPAAAGTPEPRRCAQCGRPVPPEARFCGTCGASLVADTDGLRSSRAALDEVFAHLRSGEQRPATILMCDLAGYTTLGEQAEPESIFRLLNDVFEELGQCLVAHGAHLDKFVGDEIMALFGVPIAQENSAERAVRAALAMQDRLETLNQSGRFGGRHLAVHMGINVGPVMVGPLGHRANADYTAIGDAVNVAKRLEDQAPTGCIYVSRAVRDMVADRFRFEDVGHLAVQGRRQKVHAYRLVGARPATDLPSPAEGRDVPMIGHEEAMRQMAAYAGDVLHRRVCACVVVAGPAGIGKSRLVAEWQHSGAPAGLVLLPIASHPFGDHFPLLPLVDLAAQLLSLRLEGWPPRVSGDVEHAVGESPVRGPAAEWLLALLRHLHTPVGEGGDDWREGIRGALRALLRARAAREAVCIVWEDFQWLDEASRTILGDLLPELRNRQILVLLNAREPGEEWPAQALGARVVRMAPLPRPAMERLVQAWADPDVLPKDTVRAICDRAQGHPYFAREMVHGLRQSASGPAVDASLPHSLHELFLSQLDRLSLPLRRLVQAASVVGEPLSHSLLAAAMPAEIRLTPALLDEAERQNLLRQGTAAGQLLFSRRLLFESAYATIPPSQRQDLHARLASYLVERLEVLGEAAVHSASHHAYLGYRDERALDLLLRSARLYRTQYANRQAIQAASRANEVIASLPHPEAFLDQRLEALLLLAQSYEVIGDLGHAEGVLAEAEILAEDSPNRGMAAKIATASATLHLMQGHVPQANEGFERAHEAWKAVGDGSRAAHALLGMGMCSQMAGERARAFALFSQAAECGDEALWVKAAALNNAGVLLLEEGRYADAESYLVEGLRANEKDGDRRGIANSKASLGEVCYRLARLEDSRRWLEEALAEAGEIEDSQCADLATVFLARVRGTQRP